MLNLSKKIRFRNIILILLLSVALVLAIVSVLFAFGKPQIKGLTDLTYYLGDAIPAYKQNISATNCFGQDITDRLNIDDSNVSWENEGEYSIFFTVEDNISAIKITDKINVSVKYVKPFFVGLDNFEYIIGSGEFSYFNGVKAYDYDKNALEMSVTPEINPNIPGKYEVAYATSDKNGVKAEKKIIITIRRALPTLILKNNELKFAINKNQDLYEIASQNVETAFNEIDLPIQFKITGLEKIDLNKLDSYQIIYTVEGLYGQTYSKSCTVTTYVAPPDIEPPEITLVQDITYNIPSALGPKDPPDEAYFLQFIKVVDDGIDITERATVDCSEVDFSSPGKYNIVFTAIDFELNKSTLSAEIFVKDVTPPIFFGIPAKYIHKIGDNLPDLYFGVSVKDNVDNEVGFSVEDDEISFNKPGKYIFFYVAEDSSGNLTRTQCFIEITD